MTTEKQHSFILSLLDSRQVDTYIESAIRKTMNGFTTKEASNTIEYLKIHPVKVAVEVKEYVKETTALDRYIAAITPLPVAKYALSKNMVEALLGRKWNNDYMFVEVSEYRGRKRIARLSGAPGGFVKHRLPMTESMPIMGAIAENWRMLSVAFAKHYNVCGRCAAELTDERSREISFGPTCAKALGIS